MRRNLHRRVGRPHRRFPIVLAILGALVLTAVITGLAGNACKNDTEAYDRLMNKNRMKVSTDEIIKTNVKSVNAEAYDPRIPIEKVKSDAVSVCLRDSDGKLAFNMSAGSAVAAYENGDRDFAVFMSDMRDAGKYVSGYFFSLWQTCGDPYSRELFKSYEIALLSEFSNAGIDDIVIIGFDVNVGSVSEICEFLNELKRKAGDTRVGADLTPEQVSETDNEVYLAAKIADSCDFILLDLRIGNISKGEDGEYPLPGEIIERYKYYIIRFSMRLLLDGDTASIGDEAEAREITSSRQTVN